MKVICLTCNKEFEKKLKEIRKTKNNFCSHSCAAIFNNKARGKKDKFCLVCNKNISNSRRKYCSDVCLINARKAKYNLDNKCVLMLCKKHGVSEFHYSKKNKKYLCIKCTARHVKHFRRRLKEELVEKLGGRCSVCGYNACIEALDFHHLDRSKKEFSIANGGRLKAKEKFMEEVKKCILVCANCHREIEAGLVKL